MAFQIGLLFFLKHKITFKLLTLIRIHSFYHSLSVTVTHCHFLLLVVICCHLLAVPLVVTHCHSLSFVVPLDVIRCHSLSFVVLLVVIPCQSLSFDVTRCTTRLSFINDHYFMFFFAFYIIYNQNKNKKNT